MFHHSHDYEAKRSHQLYYDLGVLIYGRIPTLIPFYLLHKPTTSELPVCHRYDFLVRHRNGLNFFRTF